MGNWDGWPDQKICPVCGKTFTCLHPDMWVYKQGKSRYFCSYTCKRESERKEQEAMAKRGLKDRIEMAKEILEKYGENPTSTQVYGYLREMGYKAPPVTWRDIKRTCMEKAPEVYEKLPKNLDAVKQPEEKKVKLVYDPAIAEEYRREQEEKVVNLSMTPDQFKEVFEKKTDYSGYEITAIRSELGEFYYDKKYGTIDWRNPEGDEISLLPHEWEKLRNEIPKMMQILGVE